MATNETSHFDNKPQPRRLGRFYLHELINSGGMADIWVASDEQGKTFALRLMHANLRFSFGSRRRFSYGCELLANLPPHEGIIGYVEHGKVEGCLYLLMEYLESSNLKQLMARSDEVFTENIANILIDTAVALEHLHDHKIMHLDFKPENVIMTRTGNVRIVDFDLCQPLPEKPKKMSHNAGTPAYMAPEHLKHLPLDHRADIFAYGVLAYELLTYEKPFKGDNADEVFQAQVHRDAMFAPPRQINPEIPPAVEKVILRCLEHDPDKRYPIMAPIVHELKNALYVK